MLIIVDMSTYILMKLFEKDPSAYDKGIKIITLGSVDKAYDRLTSLIKKNDKVLDIGCGTGAISLRAAVQGASVKGIDINPGMLTIAKKRAIAAVPGEKIDFCEMGVAELEAEKSGEYDVVTGGLCFSELSKDELLFTLKQVRRILRPGGFFLVADEVVPKPGISRFLFFFLRCLLVIITWVITRTTTHALKNLKADIENNGFSIISERRSAFGSFTELTAQKKES